MPTVEKATFCKLTPSVFQQAIQPGMVVYDVGGGNGTMASAAASKGATVYIIEAHPLNVSALREKFAENPLVQVIHAAAGDTDSDVRLYPRNQLTHAMWPDPKKPAGSPMTVPGLRLDSIRWDAPDVVKVDVQGWEARVLRGAQRILAAKKTKWVLEMWPKGLADSGGGYEAVLEQLEPYTTPLDGSHQLTTWDAVLAACEDYLRGTKVYFDLWAVPA